MLISKNAASICDAVDSLQPFTGEERRLMLEFIIWSKKNCPTFCFYHKYAKELVQKMDAGGYRWSDIVGFEQSILTLLRGGNNIAAYQLYRDSVIEWVNKYWTDCNSDEWNFSKHYYHKTNG